MSWATQAEVLKHYKMVTKGEAAARQLLLTLSLGILISCTYFIFKIFSYWATTLACFYVFLNLLDIFFPTRKYKKHDFLFLLSKLLTERFARSNGTSSIGPQNTAASSATETAEQPTTQSTEPQKEKTDKPAGDTQPLPTGNKDTSSVNDVPHYEHTFPDNRPLMIRLALSRQGVVTSKTLFSASLAFFIIREVFTIPWTFIAPILLVTNSGAVFLFLTNLLYHIELRDIDDFPKKFIDKAMLALQHKLSFSRGYFFIGTVDNFKIGLRRMNRFLHILVGAPTGEGKSTSLIIPQLLFDADSIGSAVVPDAKSPDLFNAVAGRWLAKRKKAFLFAPWHKDTIAINFLPDADDQDLLTIVEVLMREREEVIGKEEAFFKARTKYLLFAIFKLAQTFTDEYCTMSTVYRMVESVSVLESFIEASSDNIKALFSDFHKLYSETKVNCLNAIREKIDICMDADVRKAFSKAEFKLGMLFEQKEPCLLVLGAPIDHKEAGTKIASLIINLIVNMAFRHRRIYKEAIQRGEQSLVPNDLYLYLDEIRNLKITALADLVAIAREIRTSVIVTTTDLGFFEYYRQDYSSLMGNLRTKLFMRGLDIESCQEISDMLGKENYINYRYMGKIMASQDEKNLLEPAQVMNLKEDKLVVFSPHTPPFIADKVSIYKSSWLEKMQVPAPREMRKLYKEWGVATEDLVDLPLPMTDGHYDVARMKSGKEPSISKNIGIDDFEEKGNTTVREPKKKETANYASEKKISKKSEGLDQEMAATQDQESK